MEIAEYIKKRNIALMTMDKESLEQLLTESNTEIPENETVFWAGMHKARIGITTMPESLKEDSRNWLSSNGFKVEF